MKTLMLVLALVSTNVFAVERSKTELRHFAKANPCPTTGKPITSCPYYVIDHIYPLCAGGADKMSNMQWQTKQAAAKKDVRERAFCACLKKTPASCTWSPK